jgi:hypothetical protein
MLEEVKIMILVAMMGGEVVLKKGNKMMKMKKIIKIMPLLHLSIIVTN